MCEREEEEEKIRKIWLENKDYRLLEGVVDVHVYNAPCLQERIFDEIDFARQALAVGYRACLSKSHFSMNADRTQLVRKMVPGFGMYGGVVLNHYVGGLNPGTVEVAIAYGAKIIWMPNIHSKNHIEKVGMPMYPAIAHKFRFMDVKPISIFDAEGEILPVVYNILELIAEADIILGTGHLSVEEGLALAKAARKIGIKKVLVQHPDAVGLTDYSLENQVKMAKEGAILEKNASHCVGSPGLEGYVSAKTLAERIKTVGVNNCVLCSGLGVRGNVHPIEGMRVFMHALMKNGISEKEIDTMAKETPARLLGL